MLAVGSTGAHYWVACAARTRIAITAIGFMHAVVASFRRLSWQ